jgi:hypothetical protein
MERQVDQRDHEGARRAAAQRAEFYLRQATTTRQIAEQEPLEQRRQILLVSAQRYERLAATDEQLASGRRYGERGVDQPQAP